jgi:hypothetical protein
LPHKQIINLPNFRFSGQLVVSLDSTFNKGVYWKTCKYQSCSKLDKLACVKI